MAWSQDALVCVAVTGGSPLCPATYKATDDSILTIIYFVFVVLFGTYIVMTLFIAILLEGFAGQDDAKFELEDMAEQVRR